MTSSHAILTTALTLLSRVSVRDLNPKEAVSLANEERSQIPIQIGPLSHLLRGAQLSKPRASCSSAGTRPPGQVRVVDNLHNHPCAPVLSESRAFHSSTGSERGHEPPTPTPKLSPLRSYLSNLVQTDSPSFNLLICEMGTTLPLISQAWENKGQKTRDALTWWGSQRRLIA